MTVKVVRDDFSCDLVSKKYELEMQHVWSTYSITVSDRGTAGSSVVISRGREQVAFESTLDFVLLDLAEMLTLAGEKLKSIVEDKY